MSDKPSEEDELRAVERLDAGEAAQSDEESRLRAPYEKLLARIRDTEEAVEPPPGWQERAMARWSNTRRRRWIRAAVASGSALVAAAAALLLRCSAMVGGPALAYDIERASGPIRSDGAVVGDTLNLSSERGSILLYRDGRRIARCPGDALCQSDGDDYSMNWKLTEPGGYDIVSLQLDGEPWVPDEEQLELGLLQANQRKAKSQKRVVQVTR